MKACYKLVLRFFNGDFKHFRSSQNSKFAMSLQYLKKEVTDEVDFLDADNVDFNILDIKVSYKVILLSLLLMTWSSILRVVKVTSLQYLYNISKKKLGMEFNFSMQINIKTSWIIVFYESSQTCPKYPK